MSETLLKNRLQGKEITPVRGYDKKICQEEGKSATFNWLMSVYICVAYRWSWKKQRSFQPTMWLPSAVEVDWTKG